MDPDPRYFYPQDQEWKKCKYCFWWGYIVPIWDLGPDHPSYQALWIWILSKNLWIPNCLKDLDHGSLLRPACNFIVVSSSVSQSASLSLSREWLQTANTEEADRRLTRRHRSSQCLDFLAFDFDSIVQVWQHGFRHQQDGLVELVRMSTVKY